VGDPAHPPAALAAALRRQHRHVPRGLEVGEGVLVLAVVTPGVGLSAPLLLPVEEAVAPGDAGTPRERAFAEMYEHRTGTEADTAPQFRALLHALRRLGI
jgi:hypothetical protein